MDISVDFLNRAREVSQSALSTLDRLHLELREAKAGRSHWVGELSASALSTATAVSALSIVVRARKGLWQYPPAVLRRWGTLDSDIVTGENTVVSEHLERLIEGGVRWLLAGANADGGYGDTDRSHSNIATTMLVEAALTLARPCLTESSATGVQQAIDRAANWTRAAGGLPALRARYGKDKTFVIPIMTNCALAGLVPWRDVMALPFEMAAVPQGMYRLMRMPVVSYAIPALVAIGQARLFHLPPRFIPWRWLRMGVVERTMRVLEQMQPESGGYLEATPLTSFVLMSLAATGRVGCEVSKSAIRFLNASVLEDGSWPIDTNLATWVTSLTIGALSRDPRRGAGEACDTMVDQETLKWLLSCQHQRRHPFTGAEPGGWGWTDLSGAVPDGDDTPAAILALAAEYHRYRDDRQLVDAMEAAAGAGVRWLFQLRNRDGGWPTFCRGWGKLPFDRSSTDLTAHALRAIHAAERTLGFEVQDTAKMQRLVTGGWQFLVRSQRSDGSILPLWFGNQDNSDDENPIYGTGRALLAAESLSGAGAKTLEMAWPVLEKAANYLISAQARDGGWGGGQSRARWLQKAASSYVDTTKSHEGAAADSPEQWPTSSVEETAVAVEALCAWVVTLRDFRGGWATGRTREPLKSAEGIAKYGGNCDVSGEAVYTAAIIRGVQFLVDAVDRGWHHEPWPIGFYFAKLWYHEKQYPTVFTVAALGAAASVLAAPVDRN